MEAKPSGKALEPYPDPQSPLGRLLTQQGPWQRRLPAPRLPSRKSGRTADERQEPKQCNSVLIRLAPSCWFSMLPQPAFRGHREAPARETSVYAGNPSAGLDSPRAWVAAFAAFVGPPMAGVLVDHTHDYKWPVFVSAASAAVGSSSSCGCAPTQRGPARRQTLLVTRRPVSIGAEIIRISTFR